MPIFIPNIISRLEPKSQNCVRSPYQRVETTHESRYQNMWVGMAEALQPADEAEAHVRAERAHYGMAFDEEAWKEGKAAQKLRKLKPKEEPAAPEPFGGGPRGR